MLCHVTDDDDKYKMKKLIEIARSAETHVILVIDGIDQVWHYQLI